MRKMLAVLAAAVLVAVAVPLAVLASNGSQAGRLDQQAALWTTTQVTTSSSSWQSIGDLSAVVICSLNQVTATVGLQLDGAPAGLRVQVDGGGFMDPGSVRFVPAGSQDSSSFTFAINTSTFEGSDNHSFDVQWRSPTGGSVTLIKGIVNLQFQRGQSC